MNDFFFNSLFTYLHVVCFFGFIQKMVQYKMCCPVYSLYRNLISLVIVLLFSLSGVLRENAGSTAGPGDLQTV